LCDFLKQSNQKKICDSKIYCIVPHLHIIYTLWISLFATCSHMPWQFLKFYISYYLWFICFKVLLYECNYICVLENWYTTIHCNDVEKLLMFNCVTYILITSIVWTYFESSLLKNLVVHFQSLLNMFLTFCYIRFDV